MNDAVWYLYLADVVGSLGSICGLLGLIFSLATLLALVASIVSAHNLADLGPPPAPLTAEEEDILLTDRFNPRGDIARWDRACDHRSKIARHATAHAHHVLCSRHTPRIALAAGLFLLGNVLTPSQNTLYAAAAVSVGKDVAATATAQKAVKALDAWLDRQINPPVEGEK